MAVPSLRICGLRVLNRVKDGRIACCSHYGHAMLKRNYRKQSEAVKLEEKHRTEQLEYINTSKGLLENRMRTPQKHIEVDLENTRGISVSHSKKENAHTTLLRRCLEEEPNVDGFSKACDHYIRKNRERHGHVNFVTAAMKFIEAYGLQKELEVYNKLFDVFPRNKFVNRTLFDAVWPKPHPQINLALDILTKMEWQGLSPSDETHDILYSIFGRASFPLQKVYRMWFWFETFKDINPYELPKEVYKDRIEIMKAGIDRILGNNDGTQIIELSQPYETEERIEYDHYVISSQSSYQQDCVKHLNVGNSLFVEGPIHMWLNHVREEYFILKTGRKNLVTSETLKVQEDEEREGVVLAVCFTARPYVENLQKWIKHLERENPLLREVNIIFNLNDYSSPDYSRPVLTAS